ncbi:MAG: molybdopterin-synthase adenylyltransferase MoeB [Enterobacterales bacterium]|nr:molybdopterin-synthase adenylyltransferase MoeB [Enterobacterales bacterium]
MMLSDQQLLQYSRQILLPDIDIEGQQKIIDAHVVIVGLGGLGSPVALYLAAAGVGKLTLVDDDRVDVSNLQRQIVHSFESQQQLKVDSAKQSLLKLNPSCQIDTLNQRLNEDKMSALVEKSTLVCDCSDNFSTRFLLNRVCFSHKKPLISGAAIRWEGQLTSFTMQPNTACYRCLYDENDSTDVSCEQNGIIGPVVGTIGCLQATEAIKAISAAGQLAVGQLLLFDALDCSFSKINFEQKADCPVCYQRDGDQG